MFQDVTSHPLLGTYLAGVLEAHLTAIEGINHPATEPYMFAYTLVNTAALAGLHLDYAQTVKAIIAGQANTEELFSAGTLEIIR